VPAGVRPARSSLCAPLGIAGRGRIACRAFDYDPILRRDPKVQANLQRWINQQAKLQVRQSGMPEAAVKDAERAAAKKAAYLAKLGIAVKEKTAQAPWDENHIAPGDVFKGYIEHPALQDGKRLDLRIVVEPSGKEAIATSEKGDFQRTFTLSQDFPITAAKGADRDRDMAHYVFSKFNAQWRKWEEPLPPRESFDHLTLGGLRQFFKIVAKVDDYPPKEEFDAAASDPEKGLTIDEFLNYLQEDDPEYLDQSFIGVFTGRRVQFNDGSFNLDGDFSTKFRGAILGYAKYNGQVDGTFALQLEEK